MKTAMGVGRCCCKEEPPIVWNSFCRAWNSEINQEFDNVVPLSGSMPNLYTYVEPNANVNNPEEWSFFVETIDRIGMFSYSVQQKNPGIEQKILGLQNQVAPRERLSNNDQAYLETSVNRKLQGVSSRNPIVRYNNEPSYNSHWLTNNSTASIPETFRPIFEFKINIRTMSPSVEANSTVPPEQSGYGSITSIRIMNPSQGYLSLNYYSITDPGLSPQKTTNIWYFGFGNAPVLDTSGNTIPVSFPCEIKFVSTNEKSGIYKRIYLYINGVKTNKSTSFYPECQLKGKRRIIWFTTQHAIVSLFIAAPRGLGSQYGTNYPLLTTPDQVIDIESFEYKIGNGHQEYLNTINWQINNGNDDWSYDSATETISANNTGIFSPREFIKSRYAYANLNLKPNSTYKLEWLSANADSNTTPRFHPFVVVDNFELSDTGNQSRYLDSLFFNTNSSGQTLLKFIGYYNQNFDVSDIRLWLVWEPLSIAYPSPFTNDATAPATNIDWRLVDGSATITPTINGGKETYTVSVQAGSLPPGCTINSSTGVITLNPSHTQATYEVGEVTIRVTDFVGEVHDAIYFWERLP